MRHEFGLRGLKEKHNEEKQIKEALINYSTAEREIYKRLEKVRFNGSIEAEIIKRNKRETRRLRHIFFLGLLNTEHI